jgi:hypothetical protein
MQCHTQYGHQYCHLHQHLELHANCEQVVKYVNTHCAWCSVNVNVDDNKESQKCETNRSMCESLRHLSTHAKVLTDKSKVGRVSSIFCQGCAEYCLFQRKRDKYQCINCCAGLKVEKENCCAGLKVEKENCCAGLKVEKENCCAGLKVETEKDDEKKEKTRTNVAGVVNMKKTWTKLFAVTFKNVGQTIPREIVEIIVDYSLFINGPCIEEILC